MPGRARARAAVAKMIIALQPTPEDTSVTHFDLEGRPATAIARLWREGDVRRCRLCRH
jgi:hypothetical protein